MKDKNSKRYSFHLIRTVDKRGYPVIDATHLNHVTVMAKYEKEENGIGFNIDFNLYAEPEEKFNQGIHSWILDNFQEVERIDHYILELYRNQDFKLSGGVILLSKKRGEENLHKILDHQDAESYLNDFAYFLDELQEHQQKVLITPPETAQTEETQKVLKEYETRRIALIKLLERFYEDIRDKEPIKNPAFTEELNELKELPETENTLIPRPDFKINDLQKTTTALFNPNNTIDRDLNLRLTGYQDNIINVGTKKDPLLTKIGVTFNQESISNENTKAGLTPFTHEQKRAFNTILSFIFSNQPITLDIPIFDIVKLQESAPWSFTGVEATRHLFNTKDPTPQQLKSFKDSFDLFMKTTIDLDTTEQTQLYVFRQLDRYYAENNLDRGGFTNDLEALLKNYQKTGEVQNFIYGSYTYREDDNGVESVIYKVHRLPEIVKSALLTKQIQTIPLESYNTPKRIRSATAEFYALQGEILKRVYKAIELIESGKQQRLNKSKKNQWLLSLDIDNFLKEYRVDFDGKNPSRDKTRLLNNAIEAVNSNLDNIPYLVNVALYPPKPRTKKTHILMAYKGRNNRLICSNKYLSCLEYWKQIEAKNTK